MKIICFLLMTATMWAQYAAVPSTSYPALDAILNAKPAWTSGSGNPSSNCTAWLDTYFNTSNSQPYLCTATNTWTVWPGGLSGLTPNTIPKATSSSAIGNSVITDDATTLSLGTNFTITESSGIPAKVAGVTTAGIGVPITGWVSNVTGQSTSQSAVTVATAPAAGSYRINYFADQNALCTTGTNSVTFTFNWTDGSNARALTTGALTFNTAQSTSGFINGLIPIYVGSGNVTYTSSVLGTCTSGTSTYDIHATLERLQ